MENARRDTRQALWITVGGVALAAVIGLALYTALPDAVQSTSSGAPRGQLEPKRGALAFLVWLVPGLAVFVTGVTAGCTALGPDFLNVRRVEAKEFWRVPENWAVARAHILRTVAVLSAGLSVLVVLATCLDAGAQAWNLPGMWWIPVGVIFLALIVWTIWRMLRLERPETLLSEAAGTVTDPSSSPPGLPRA